MKGRRFMLASDFEVIEASDIMEAVYKSINKPAVEDFLSENLEDYLLELEEFHVTNGMFPNKQNKHSEVVRFRSSDIEDTAPFFKLLKLMTNCLDDSENVLSINEFGNDINVSVRFDDRKYYTIKLEKIKGYTISLETTTCSGLVDELEIA